MIFGLWNGMARRMLGSKTNRLGMSYLRNGFLMTDVVRCDCHVEENVLTDMASLIFRLRLKHKDTGIYLSNHAVSYQRPIQGRTEVFGSKKTGKTVTFRAGEGVYFET